MPYIEQEKKVTKREAEFPITKTVAKVISNLINDSNYPMNGNINTHYVFNKGNKRKPLYKFIKKQKQKTTRYC